jgi:cyclic pyranopterin phosphate synthase
VNTCNFACVYCVSPGDEKKTPVRNPISSEELCSLVLKIKSQTALETIRLTGGEPLLYKGLDSLIKSFSDNGLSVKMTTNAYYLKSKITALKEAGLKSINVSLDAADSEKFFQMTRKRCYRQVTEGIDKALETGIDVKLNSVIIKGENEDQILPLLEFAGKRNIPVRFLELMKMGHLYDTHDHKLFSENEMLELISTVFGITPLERTEGATAKYFTTSSGYKFGIISNTSDPFCGDCNRLRIDSYGNIYGCLSSELGLSVREADEDELKKKLKVALGQKKRAFTGSNLSMKFIGG